MSLGYEFKSARQSFHLAVGQGAQIHVEEYGSEHGIPVVICHGGPGAGLLPASSCLFNPRKYRIILFSQRGSGLSTPDSLTNNSPIQLVKDINILLDYLGIEKSVIAGGSWGATLALLFYQHYPERVLGLIMWASFLAEQSDLTWLYGPDGAGAQFYPELYQDFSCGFKTAKEILTYYYASLTGDDELEQHKAAHMWMAWESKLALGLRAKITRVEQAHCAIQQAKVMCHFFQEDNFSQLCDISEFKASLCHLPCWLIHSRDDLLCRYAPVQRFAQKHKAQFYVLENAGHAQREGDYMDAIIRASDLMLCRLH
ncbi:proline iminopeptidase [Pseudoalteromonas phenolica]|uniref:alpha/beta fold hydrolase n=1 Tax=Pseudoalteromonas phenolica TaxID=161398 RepID=UPI00110BEEDC|nr:alpha/beta fold hydrolase [Pseudoalteromonas phenolica]TMN90781.1 proline iminopeptidase [Pseudoalteromonas phenolica]